MTALGPGSLVRCIDDRPTEDCGFVPPPGVSWWGSMDGLKRGIYTIRDVFLDPDDGQPCVRLFEIVRPRCRWLGMEPGYAACRFVPVDDTIFQIDQYTDLPNEVEAV